MTKLQMDLPVKSLEGHHYSCTPSIGTPGPFREARK